ncbi:MAG: flagella basal body P-ring formation protein FlgA [Spirochaetaceae bacterium]
MRKKAVYAAAIVMLSLLCTASLFGMEPAHGKIDQLTLREVISPDTLRIELPELFKSPSLEGETDTDQSAAESRIRGPGRVMGSEEDMGLDKEKEPGGVKEFRGDAQPFGSKPAFIPFWQLSAVIKEKMRTEEKAIVGKGSFYLPSKLNRVEKSVSTALLKEITERENIDDTRVELDLSSVPTDRIQSRMDGEAGPLRAELITDSGGSFRFALYAENGEASPVAVVQAGVRRYAKGYSAVASMRKGDAVTAENLEPAPVPISRTGTGGFGSSSSGDNDYRGNKGKSVSLGGLDSGYEYTLKRDVKAGEIIEPSILKKTPPVERGDQLICRFEKGSLLLTLEGRALSSGGLGDMVRVRLSTGKYRELEITGKREVRNKLSGSEG